MSFDTFVDAINDFIKWFTQIMTDFVGMFKKDGGPFDPTATYGA